MKLTRAQKAALAFLAEGGSGVLTNGKVLVKGEHASADHGSGFADSTWLALFCLGLIFEHNGRIAVSNKGQKVLHPKALP